MILQVFFVGGKTWGFSVGSVEGWDEVAKRKDLLCFIPGIPTTIKTMGVNITTIVYLRVLIIQIGSTIILMVVEAQGCCYFLI